MKISSKYDLRKKYSIVKNKNKMRAKLNIEVA
jgi:hypothetical protein